MMSDNLNAHERTILGEKGLGTRRGKGERNINVCAKEEQTKMKRTVEYEWVTLQKVGRIAMGPKQEERP